MSSLSPDVLKSRQAKLIEALSAAGLDGIILNPSESLTYLTGLHFHLSERPVVGIFTPNIPPVIVLPELESAKTADLPYPAQAITYSEDITQWAEAFKRGTQAAGLTGGKLGVEDRKMRFLELEFLRQALPGAEFVNAVETIATLRMYKDASEKANMQAAADIAQQALAATLPHIKIGMTEREVASEIVLQIFRLGSDTKLPFMPIVGSGPNSANPHAFVSDRKLGPGELLVIDWGATVQGYFSDLTRTFAIGEYSAEQEQIHNLVREANAAARAKAAPGATCGEVDKAARDVIEAGGYGEYFIHRTGHGLGMEGHEEPYIRAGNPMVLEPGMSFTIEPGIYHPEYGGVRIEDDVIVTADGLHSFSSMAREIQVVG